MTEGTALTVLTREGDESFVLDATAEAELLESIAEANRGDLVPAEDALRSLRKSEWVPALWHASPGDTPAV